MRFFTPFLLALFVFTTGFAQQADPVAKAKAYVLEKSGEWNVSSADLKELTVTNNYVTQHSGTRHIYLTQHYKGIPIKNAIQSIAIAENGKVFSPGKTRFISNLQDKVNSTKPSLTGTDAIGKLMMNLEKRAIDAPQILEEMEGEVLYDGKGIAKQDILVRLVYEQMPNGELLLAYQVQLDQLNSNDWWNASVDARNGEILAKDNFTISCTFEHQAFHNHDRSCNVKTTFKSADVAATAVTNSYKVIPFPYESPIHSDFTIVSNPADPVASPFGWHDIDGVDGAEYTITRGNNVHAFQDHGNINGSSNDEPDGGAGLDFLFDANFDLDPMEYADAATTNLFYYLNVVHDFAYHYGFDEAAGNFQKTNYTGQGADEDEVQAHSQDGYLTGSLNNANYSGGPDGAVPTIQMFVWDVIPGAVVVTEPASVSGSYGSIGANFGPPAPIVPIVAEVIEVNDGLYNPYITDACEALINNDELMGKIALIDRGGCNFIEKANFAEEAGAVAVIVCNFEDDPIVMGAAAGFPDPSIPSVMMGAIDCSTIRAFAGNGLEVSLGTPMNNGPDFLDGDFDNGIIAHELAHGISNRLTGGPQTADCLFNAEQMGEGWSDFFSLVMSVQAGDTGADKRGVGTFVNRQETDGRGIRRYPYSTDMSISPLTYGDVASSTGVHAVGEVWAGIIWDLYWALVDVYGFDEDLYTGDKGNNLAVQLVMDGMKLQNCSPGFVDGREGILAADEIITGGANSCLIWEVFARRGVGYYADQGSSDSASDQTEDFEPLPTCIEELKIAKEVTPLVEAGESIDVTLAVVNHRPETLAGVTITETLPDGLSYVDGSASISPTLDGSLLTFDLGTMEYLDEMEITFKLATDADKFSQQLYFQGGEDELNGWAPFPIEGSNVWYPTDIPAEVYSGTRAFKVDSRPESTQQILLLSEEVEIEGENPVIRMYTNYDTEGGQDGGVFQVTDNFDQGIWSNFKEEIFRGGYPGAIDYGTFVIPDFAAFWGNSGGYKASYVDMNAYQGQKLFLRYNFATSDEDGAGAPAAGFWAVDDLELMDMINYNPETCITYNNGPNTCVVAEERGTIIESKLSVGTKDIQNSGIEFGVYPNPAQDQLMVSVTSLETGKANISLISVDGKVINSQSITTTPNTQQFSMQVGHLPAGFYVVRIANKNGSVNKKVVVQ